MSPESKSRNVPNSILNWNEWKNEMENAMVFFYFILIKVADYVEIDDSAQPVTAEK